MAELERWRMEDIWVVMKDFFHKWDWYDPENWLMTSSRSCCGCWVGLVT
jgi:hypothetical protein